MNETVAILVGVLAGLFVLVLLLFLHQFERLEYRRLTKLEKAREAWAKMIGPSEKHE